MNREELRKLIRGTIVTLPTPFDDERRLDLPRMTDLTHWWVEQGLGTDSTPLKVAAAMGEGPTLGDDEWPQLLRTVVDAAGSDSVIIGALKTKDTMHAIEDAKKAQDLGAVGLQIDPPMFHGADPGRLRSLLFGHLRRHRYRHHDLQHALVRMRVRER